MALLELFLMLLIILCVGLSGGFLVGLFTADRFVCGTSQFLEESKALTAYIAQHGPVEGSYGLVHKDGDIYSSAGIRNGKFHQLVRMCAYPQAFSMAEELIVRHSPYRDRPTPTSIR